MLNDLLDDAEAEFAERKARRGELDALADKIGGDLGDAIRRMKQGTRWIEVGTQVGAALVRLAAAAR